MVFNRACNPSKYNAKTPLLHVLSHEQYVERHRHTSNRNTLTKTPTNDRKLVQDAAKRSALVLLEPRGALADVRARTDEQQDHRQQAWEVKQCRLHVRFNVVVSVSHIKHARHLQNSPWRRDEVGPLESASRRHRIGQRKLATTPGRHNSYTHVRMSRPNR